MPVDVQTPEQGFISLEEFAQGINQEALAEPAGAGQKPVSPRFH